MADAPLPELAANYGRLNLLGKSPLGETWRARDKQSGQNVVLKIRPISDAASRYFQRELALARQITHPRLQRMLTSMQTPTHLVMVYEFIPGKSLADELAQGQPLKPARALRIALQLLDTLHTIHQSGFIYRDLSPQNIIMRGRSDPVLIDFNAIGQLTENSSLGQSTVVGELSGKPLYMSPEQMAAAPQTASSDMWTLGAVLYEMLAGKPYRTGNTFVEVVDAAMSPGPPDVSDAPAPYRDILSNLLNTDPASRPKLTVARKEISRLHGAATSNVVASGIRMDEFGDVLKKDFRRKEKDGLKTSEKQLDNWGDFGEPLGVDDTPPASLPAPSAGPVFFPDPPQPRSALPAKKAKGGLILGLLLAFMIGVAGFVFFSAGLLNDVSFRPDPATLNALLFLVAAVAIVGVGHMLSRRVHSRAEDVRSALPFQAVDLISGDDARDQLSKTICMEIDAYRLAAAGSGDDILTITMVAVAQEYRDAESSDDRIKALQMLADLNAKISSRLKPWWLDYEKLVARGISLVSLGAGAVALFQAIQTLL